MSQTKADADNLIVRIQLEALVSEREGMKAENMARKSRGEAMAYNDTAFNHNAEDIRALAALVKT